MIARLRGQVLEKDLERVVLDAGGVGYELMINAATSSRLPEPGGSAELHVFESAALYGGTVTLYGFSSRQEKELFLCLKEHVPSTGAKKALEYLEKASRSLPDFQSAVMQGDARVLSSVFGFTSKTAQKLLSGLKDKLGGIEVSGTQRVLREGPSSVSTMARTVEALAALGYKPSESGPAVESAAREFDGREASVEDMLRLSLKRLR
ncbi:MAG: Holliday junction branch migration protein RuvA [Elusimicrobiota bacterium]|jgi:Holliday junction DNA helicase RuvA